LLVVAVEADHSLQVVVVLVDFVQVLVMQLLQEILIQLPLVAAALVF